MKKVVGLGAAVVAVALSGAPLAQADDASFVQTVKALGFQHSSVNLVSAGESACYFLRRNRDPGQITERVERYLAVSPALGRRFLVLSVDEYCPEYRAQVGG